MGFEPEPSKEGSWMMAQNGLVVAGIDVAKGKVDACIRALSQRRTFESTAEGRRQLVSWLRKHKATKVVMEASGGYEREWAKALREKEMAVRIVDPKRSPSPLGDWPRMTRSTLTRSPGLPRPSARPRARPTTRNARSFCRS